MKNYHEEYEEQLGIDFIYKAIQVNNYQIKLQIQLSPGHERFQAMLKSCMKGTDYFLLVYDITDK